MTVYNTSTLKYSAWIQLVGGLEQYDTAKQCTCSFTRNKSLAVQSRCIRFFLPWITLDGRCCWSLITNLIHLFFTATGIISAHVHPLLTGVSRCGSMFISPIYKVDQYLIDGITWEWWSLNTRNIWCIFSQNRASHYSNIKLKMFLYDRPVFSLVIDCWQLCMFWRERTPWELV